MERNPCWECGFYDCDFGCTADLHQPWTVPKECGYYDDEALNELISYYEKEREKEKNEYQEYYPQHPHDG